jgi:23S rRNA (guanosine2251-2'-O)-methyltransferase
MRPKPNATPDDLAFGINPSVLAVETGAARSLIYLEENRNPRLAELVRTAQAAGVPVAPAPLQRLDELTGGGVHQGVLVRLRALDGIDLRAAAAAPGPGLAILLDGITDPQNVGAIMRAAVAVGVSAVVLPRRRGALLTPGVHRASAGLSFLAPVAAPQNLAQAVEILKERGYWVAAAALAPDAQPATTFDWPQKTALILGSEGEGVSSLLLREADFRVALPMDPRVESLNVGVACGALAYLYRRQWPANA